MRRVNRRRRGRGEGGEDVARVEGRLADGATEVKEDDGHVRLKNQPCRGEREQREGVRGLKDEGEDEDALAVGETGEKKKDDEHVRLRNQPYRGEREHR